VSKEIKVGILAIVSGVLLYFGFNFLKGSDFFSNTKKYYVEYKNVDKLTVSNPVIVNGLSIGRVSSIELNQSKGIILVELEIRDDFIIGDTTKAILINSDFLGGKAIELEVGDISIPKDDGDTLISKISNPFDKVLETTGDVATDLEITITRINGILAGMQGSGEDIAKTIKGLSETIDKVNATIDGNAKSLEQTIKATKELITGMNKTFKKIDPILDNTNEVISGFKGIKLQETLDKTNSLLINLDSTVSQFKTNQGTLGKLMNNDSVYNNLNQLLIDLDKFTNHLNEYPKDFFSPLGRKHKKVKKNLE